MCQDCHDLAHSKRSSARNLISVGIRKAQEEGLVFGRPPFGYEKDHNLGKLIPHQGEQDAIVRIFELKDGGMSHRNIYETVKSEGHLNKAGKSIGRTTVYRIMNSAVRKIGLDEQASTLRNRDISAANDRERRKKRSVARDIAILSDIEELLACVPTGSQELIASWIVSKYSSSKPDKWFEGFMKEAFDKSIY